MLSSQSWKFKILRLVLSISLDGTEKRGIDVGLQIKEQQQVTAALSSLTNSSPMNKCMMKYINV